MTASAVYNAGHDHGRLNTTDAGISRAPCSDWRRAARVHVIIPMVFLTRCIALYLLLCSSGCWFAPRAISSAAGARAKVSGVRSTICGIEL